MKESIKVGQPRRVVLSRKGFDSGYGGMPSPILPDGRLVALPIPASHDHFTMADLHLEGIDLGALLGDLSKGRHSLSSPIHLDPDLDRSADRRLAGWRPSLGQTGGAQSHLHDSGVGSGDVFLFFGWFRQAERYEGRWRYERSAPNLHVLFGWLEVDEVLPIVTDRQRCLERHPWIADHPHVANPTHYTDPRNTLYIASHASRIVPHHVGGGGFVAFRSELQLTMPGRTRSVWRLPSWMLPTPGTRPLSFHGDIGRWSRDDDGCVLRSVAKGQEFVLDVEHYPQAVPWLDSLVSAGRAMDNGSLA